MRVCVWNNMTSPLHLVWMRSILHALQVYVSVVGICRGRIQMQEWIMMICEMGALKASRAVSEHNEWWNEKIVSSVLCFHSQSELFRWIPGQRWLWFVWGIWPSYTRSKRLCLWAWHVGAQEVQCACVSLRDCTHSSQMCVCDVLEPGVIMLWRLRPLPSRRSCILR